MLSCRAHERQRKPACLPEQLLFSALGSRSCAASRARPCRGRVSARRTRARWGRARSSPASPRRFAHAVPPPLCEARASASSASLRPSRSAARLGTSGSACKTLTAQRGKIGRSMSPSEATRPPSASSTATAPRCVDSIAAPHVDEHWVHDTVPLAEYGKRPSERVGPCLGRPGAAARVTPRPARTPAARPPCAPATAGGCTSCGRPRSS